MEYILYEVNGAVGKITINREKALNALNSQVLDELNTTLSKHCIVRTNSDVTAHCNLTAAAECKSIHCCNYRNRKCL